MKKIIPLPFLLAATLMACGKPDPAETSSKPAPTETVEALAANPARLKELREQCKTDRAKLGGELCNRVAEATDFGPPSTSVSLANTSIAVAPPSSLIVAPSPTAMGRSSTQVTSTDTVAVAPPFSVYVKVSGVPVSVLQ